MEKGIKSCKNKEDLKKIRSKYLHIEKQKFNHLTALRLDEEATLEKHRLFYWFKCDYCGKIVSLSVNSVVEGHTKSCSKSCTRRALNDKRPKNKYDLSGEYGIGYSVKEGYKFIFDKEDYDKIKDYHWICKKSGYVYTTINNKHIYLYNLIMNKDEKDKRLVDHINRNPFDNRKCNLRFVTHQENIVNKSLQKNNTSNFSGVNYRKDINKWRAYITVNNRKQLTLGCFENKEDAVRKRLQAELDFFGRDLAPQRDLFEKYGIK